MTPIVVDDINENASEQDDKTGFELKTYDLDVDFFSYLYTKEDHEQQIFDEDELNSNDEGDFEDIELKTLEQNTEFIDRFRQLNAKFVHVVPHMYINDLLSILNKYTETTFPKTAVTLLNTPKYTEIFKMDNGEY